MGRGDRKTKKGKIFKSSFGKNRPKKAKNVATRTQYVSANAEAAAE